MSRVLCDQRQENEKNDIVQKFLDARIKKAEDQDNKLISPTDSQFESPKTSAVTDNPKSKVKSPIGRLYFSDKKYFLEESDCLYKRRNTR